MVRAIEEITLNQGIDPRDALMIGGGGGAGLYATGIARRLRSPSVVIPQTAAALSATGALLSDLQTDYALTDVTSTADFDFDRANRALDRLADLCRGFSAGPGRGAVGSKTLFYAEARYPHQVWEIEVPLPVERFESDADVEQFRNDFHAVHEELFGISDADSPVELVTWRAHVSCSLRTLRIEPAAALDRARGEQRREVYFGGQSIVDAGVRDIDSLEPGEVLPGPLIVESATTTIVVDPDAAVERLPSGSLRLLPFGPSERADERRVGARAGRA
jgi:N-methylhydantoinase A